MVTQVINFDVNGKKFPIIFEVYQANETGWLHLYEIETEGNPSYVELEKALYEDDDGVIKMFDYRVHSGISTMFGNFFAYIIYTNDGQTYIYDRGDLYAPFYIENYDFYCGIYKDAFHLPFIKRKLDSKINDLLFNEVFEAGNQISNILQGNNKIEVVDIGITLEHSGKQLVSLGMLQKLINK